MPQCLVRKPELFRVGDAEVRCLLYAEKEGKIGEATEVL
jgi:hypothetical protein